MAHRRTSHIREGRTERAIKHTARGTQPEAPARTREAFLSSSNSATKHWVVEREEPLDRAPVPIPVGSSLSLAVITRAEQNKWTASEGSERAVR
jgi:hypothetical protein